MDILEILQRKTRKLPEKRQKEVLALVDAMLDSVQDTQDNTDVSDNAQQQ